MRRNIILLKGLTLALASLCFWAWLVMSPKQPETLAYPVEGQLYRWSFELNSEGDNSFDAFFGSQKDPSKAELYHTKMQGQLTQRILARTAEGSQILFTCDTIAVKVLFNGQEDAELARRLACIRGDHVVVTYDAHGSLLDMRTPKDSKAASSAWMMIINRMLIPRFLTKEGQTLSAADENGPYQVTVHHDTKKSLLTMAEQRFSQHTTSPFSTAADYRNDLSVDLGNVTIIKGQQTLNFMANNRAFSRVQNRWSIEQVSQENLQLAALNMLRKEAEQWDQKLDRSADEDRVRWQKLMKEKPLSELLAKIQEGDFGSSNNRIGQTLAQLRAHLHLDPNALPALLSLVTNAELDSPAFVYGLGTLIQVGTPEIQSALTTLLESGFSADDKRQFRLIAQLHDLKQPEPKLVEAMLTIAQHQANWIGESAWLAVGSLAGRLSSEGHALGQKMVKNILQQWEKAESVDVKVRTLRALGNAGVPETLDVSRQALSSKESYLIRKAAAQALRAVDGPEVQALLLQSYQQDRNVEVKRAALQSLHQQQLSQTMVLTLLHDFVSSSAEDSLKILIMKVLWRYQAEESLIRQAVQQAVTRGADLGREAQRLLDQTQAT